jgi:hypothetical protein
MKVIAFVFALTLASVAALAQVGLPWPGPGGVSAPAGYQGPGNILTGATMWVGLRAYTAAAATAHNKAVNVKSTSHSNETCDIGLGSDGFIGGTGSVTSACSGADNGVSLSTFCTSNTDCHVVTFYDQSGNSNNQVASTQAVLSISPLKVLCTTSTPYDTSFNGTPNISIPQPATASYVAQRTSGTSSFNVVVGFETAGNAQAGFNNASQQLFIYGGSAAVGVTTGGAEGTQLAVQTTFDGANSVIYENGNNNAGLSPGTGSATSGVISICVGNGSNGLAGNFWEAGIWQGTTANHTNFPYSSMNSNQRGTSGWNF